MAYGLTRVASVPAEKTSKSSPPSRPRSASAIWLRAELCVQTKRTRIGPDDDPDAIATPVLRRPGGDASSSVRGNAGPNPPASSRNRATAWGRSEYQIQVPRRSPSIQPASRRTLRWCDTVGWLTSQQAVKSQAQTSAQSLSWRRIASRVGSAAAWRSRTSGSVWRFMRLLY